MSIRMLAATAAVLFPLMAPVAAEGQSGTAHPQTEMLVARPGDAPPTELRLAAGERIAVRVEGDIAIGDKEVGPGPVADAALGEVIARFGDSGAFAWPRTPAVWTAPAAGTMTFAVNAHPAHRARGEAEITVLRLGPLGAPPPPGFEPPLLQLERVAGGVRARWSDRAGFGVEPATLVFELTTSHETLYRLDSWERPGPAEVTLRLPPPGLTLPPGVHTLTATIEDRLGNASPPSTIRFDTP